MPIFDVVIGNPPYNGKKTKGNGGSMSGNAIWQKFVENAYKILHSGGYLCYVHPIDWRIGPVGKKKKVAQDILLSNQILYAKLFVTPFDDVSQVVDWYIMEKKSKYKNTIVKFANNVKLEMDISKEPLPNYGGEKINSIINKVFKTENNGFIGANTWWFDPDKGENKTYKYAHGVNFTKNEYKYYDTPHNDQFKKKVIMCDTRPIRAMYDKGNIGIAGHIHYILVDNKKQANFFINIVNSNLIQFLSKLYSFDVIRKDGKTARWQNAYPLTKILIDDVILQSDEDIYDYFNLSKEEINLIKNDNFYNDKY